MKIIYVRATEETNDQLLTIIKRFENDNQTTISKNKMIIKLIKDKYNDQERNKTG